MDRKARESTNVSHDGLKNKTRASNPREMLRILFNRDNETVGRKTAFIFISMDDKVSIRFAFRPGEKL